MKIILSSALCVSVLFLLFSSQHALGLMQKMGVVVPKPATASQVILMQESPLKLEIIQKNKESCGHQKVRERYTEVKYGPPCSINESL